MSDTPTPADGPSRAERSGPAHAGLILTILCTAQVILAVDVTAVNVANSSIEHALGFTTANLQWTVTAYSLTFGGFLLLGGRMSDLFGRRRLFIGGIAAFALTSLAAGFSHDTAELISARAAQGLCAAVVSPAVLSLLAAAFPEGRTRQRAYSMWAIAGSVGGLTGFFFGGLVVSVLSWRWIFFINIPIAGLAITGALLLLHPVNDKTRARKLDIPGAITVTGGLALVVYGLGEAQSTSWTDTRTLVALCLAPFVLVGFILVERRVAEPLLPFALIRRRAAVGNILSAIQTSLGASTAFLAPLYMQQIWGFRADEAGAATLPLSVGFGIGARITAQLARRIGVRPTTTIGFILAGSGLAWMARTPVHPSYVTSFLPALVIRGFGQGVVVVQALGVATAGVKSEDQGVAAGLFNMSQQLGGALGLAAVATVAAAAGASGIGTHLITEAHGFRFGFGVAACFGFTGAIIAITALRSPDRVPPATAITVHRAPEPHDSAS